MSKFKNMKIRIKDAEHNKQVQACLYELGYKWVSQNVFHDSNLFVYTDGLIYNGAGERYFNEHGNEETTLEQLQSMLAKQEPSNNFNPEYTIDMYMNQLRQLLKDSKTSVTIYHDEIQVCNMDNDEAATVKSWDEVLEVIKVKQQYLAKFKGE